MDDRDLEYILSHLAYNTFVWNFGTTSFRTKQMNFSIERQLELLSEFWKDENNAKCGWEKEYLHPNQPYNIYEIKNRYYDFMRDNSFITGDDKIKYKAAREKTSGLVDIGVINRDHRLTEVGETILKISRSGDYTSKNILSISKDSLIYLSQLLKHSIALKDGYVRPFVVLLYLLSEVGPLTFEEFTYLAPLCTSEKATSSIVDSITKLRNGEISLNDIIYQHIMRQQNYQDAYYAWINTEVSEEIVTAIGINRKSRKYDKIYYQFYLALKQLFVDNNPDAAIKVYNISKKIQVGRYWRELLFDTISPKAIKNDPLAHLNVTEFTTANTETKFKEVFFKYLHLYKVKSTLYDYFDLNRRYIKLSNIILFENGQLKYDLVPKPFFTSAMHELYKLAYSEAENLEQLTSLEDICPALKLNEQHLLDALNNELGTNLNSIDEVSSEAKKQKYERFNNMITTRFSDDQLIKLLNDFDSRNDDAIFKAVSDNADIPTIFEYVLGIIWYKTSEFKGHILDYLKLSLDADLLPVTHAVGGDADIVYEYAAWPPFYPKHNLLLEATLADSTNQRRMEMEPVSRHLGRHLLRTRDFNNYCIFATTHLDVNVISDFKSRKHIPYYDTQNDENFIQGMKIIPLDSSDLREIIRQGRKYRDLYPLFEEAYQQSDKLHPKKWYNELVRISPID
ncbi:MAG: AlwI family type II restriction endonuclease [Duncaniella sp.]|uniref:AlwI family type II restriction endonuclease n=1 Tax=Duncaniella sp. TaxID=2518496 RepID=UPI0023D57838|nr:AlwI family type II restriction endonuclease [Duncaniella sp.]MDE6091079.1 AlwI family type II restriction endonuclease [Duncaniella sp.]